MDLETARWGGRGQHALRLQHRHRRGQRGGLDQRLGDAQCERFPPPPRECPLSSARDAQVLPLGRSLARTGLSVCCLFKFTGSYGRCQLPSRLHMRYVRSRKFLTTVFKYKYMRAVARGKDHAL